jgi:hypothetical protein
VTAVNGLPVSRLSMYLGAGPDLIRLACPTVTTKVTQGTYSYYEIDIVRVSTVGPRKWNRTITPVTHNVEVLGSSLGKEPNIFYIYIYILYIIYTTAFVV